MTARKIAAAGATLYAEADGPDDAPAVLLWAGGSCTLRMWDHVVPRLTPRLRVVRFDIRGLGRSTPATDPATQCTFEQYADDANRVLDAFDVERCHIWSMAWGSRAALAYCSLNPARVVSAALFEANTELPDVAAQRRGSQQARERQRAAGIDSVPPPEGWNAHEHPEAVSTAMQALRRFDLASAVPRLTMPVLVATGDCDPNLPSSREIVARAPDARLVVFEDVGHGSVLQRPDLATETFLQFVAAQGGR